MKVCFLSWHFATPQIFLDYLRPLSPGKSGKWREMEAVTDPYEADFIVIFDGYTEKFPIKEGAKVIYICQHPKVDSSVYGTRENMSKSFKPYIGIEKGLFFNSDNSINAGEWWLDLPYDVLKSMNTYIPKTKNLCLIMTYQTHNPMYAQRVKFAEALVNAGIDFDLYGRPEDRFRENPILSKVYKGSLGVNDPDGHLGNHKTGKDNILMQYKYSIEIDVGPTQNYFSERFYDALLLWTKPFYFGSVNTHKYFPEGSFVQLDIVNPEVGVEQIKYELSQNCINWEPMERARKLILDKYQTWPFVYNVIKGLK